MKLNQALADIQGTGPDVVYIAGQGCSGCITSFINSAFFQDIGTLALDTLDINFCDTIQAAPGVWLDNVEQTNSASLINLNAAGGYVLLVEGSCPVGKPAGNGSVGDYCHVGDIVGATVGEKFTDVLYELAQNAAAILTIGTCSSFGGIPAARGSETGATDTKTFLTLTGTESTPSNAAAIAAARGGAPVTKPIVRVPGCPPHPDWIVGTVLQYLAAPTALVGALNGDGAPYEYYGEYICNAGPCTWRYNNVMRNNQPKSNNSDFGTLDEVDGTYPAGNSRELGKNKWKGAGLGCIGILGCKGRKTKADCSARKWNSNAKEEYGNKMAWCVGSRAGCHGCTNPTFPDGVGKFFTIA